VRPTFDPAKECVPKIQDYGVIGDSRAVALVSCTGSIDWLCWPRFDSESIFAALLDANIGGRWQIAPTQPYCVERRYAGCSNVLETHFQSDSGEAILTDLMPVASEEFKRGNLLPDHEIIRQVECVSGEIRLRIVFHPRARYGLRPVAFHEAARNGLRLEVGRGVYWLRSSLPLELRHDRAEITVQVKSGDALQFSLTYSQESPAVLPPLGLWTRQNIARTVAWWENWARQCTYDGPYRNAVVRSALVLKLLTYAQSGAIVAAPTASLPERVGADLNWDYRYCWLRDASLTIRALLAIGYDEEAEAFLEWMLHATRITRPELRILYTVFGEKAPPERELRYLAGYSASRPVRIGNAARDQLQLDVYGEVIDAAAQFAYLGKQFDRMTQKVLIGFANYAAQHWHLPDNGIWEPRGSRRHNTNSRLLCWTALDRLITLAEQGAWQGVPLDRFRRERESIRREIEEHAWNQRLGSYVAVLDGDGLDASLLLLVWYGFEKPDSQRMRGTYRALRNYLGVGDQLIYRYMREPPEGAFGICAFWEAEYLALGGGSLPDAQVLFERLLSYRNDLGLLGEEINPTTGEPLGNFPQGFTHVGLIGAAVSLQQRAQGVKPLGHREETQSGVRHRKVRP
jgi:GH15 family glucan-1,4-alpha-glucosidase